MNENTRIKLIWLGFPIYSFTLMMIIYVMVSITGFTIYHKNLNLDDNRFFFGFFSAIVGTTISVIFIAALLTIGKPPAYYICDTPYCQEKATKKFEKK